MTTLSGNHKVGLSLRPSHFPYLEQRPLTHVAWFEAKTEDYLSSRGRPFEMLTFIRQDYPVALHGLSLNVGNPEGIRMDYLQKLKDLTEQIEPFIVSDHLCWTGTSSQYMHDLLPLPFTEDSIATVVHNIDFVQNYLKRSLVLENVSTYISYRHSEMSEWDFISEVSRRSGCAILLDLNNIHVNSHNHGYDPVYFINHIPLERVAQVHVSGPENYDGILYDSHSHAVPEPVWGLLKLLAPEVRHLPLLLERDENIPDFAELESEVLKALSILESSYEAERSTEPV